MGRRFLLVTINAFKQMACITYVVIANYSRPETL